MDAAGGSPQPAWRGPSENGRWLHLRSAGATPCTAILRGYFLYFSLPPPFFSPFTSFCKWQGCPTWLLIPTLVAVGTAAHLPATPPCPPHAGHSPSPTVPQLPTTCDRQNGESFLSAKEITDGEIILTKTRFKKTLHAEHCLGD